MTEVTNAVILEELRKSHEIDEITPGLLECFVYIVERFLKKPNWCDLPEQEDMRQEALLFLVRSWRTFKLDRSDNPFAFFTIGTHGACLQIPYRRRKWESVHAVSLSQQEQ